MIEFLIILIFKKIIIFLNKKKELVVDSYIERLKCPKNITDETLKILLFCYKQDLESNKSNFFFYNFYSDKISFQDHFLNIKGIYNNTNVEKKNYKKIIETKNDSKIISYLLDNGYFKYVNWIINDIDNNSEAIQYEITDKSLMVLTLKSINFIEWKHILGIFTFNKIKLLLFLRLILNIKFSIFVFKIKLANADISFKK